MSNWSQTTVKNEARGLCIQYPNKELAEAQNFTRIPKGCQLVFADNQHQVFPMADTQYIRQVEHFGWVYDSSGEFLGD